MKWMCALVLAALVLMTPAAAITNGEPDAGRHPYVVLIGLDFGYYMEFCSGSLLSPKVVLTAAHCTSGANWARVWLKESIETIRNFPFESPDAYEGTAYANPEFRMQWPEGGIPGFSYRDVGVVVLSKPVPKALVSQYAELPSPGLVDQLANKTPLDLVGYGVQERIHVYRKPWWTNFGYRFYAPTELISNEFVHSAEFLKIAMNPGGGSGGTCFGDSGGPDLLRDSRTVLAVNSYVINYSCGGVGYSSRIDIPEVLDWIQSFLN